MTVHDAPVNGCECGSCKGYFDTKKSEVITNDVERFEQLVRVVCPVGGNAPEVNGNADLTAPVADYGVRLGNVEFWIDADGPWAGKLSFSIPTLQWDKDAVSRDLQAKLIESQWSK